MATNFHGKVLCDLQVDGMHGGVATGTVCHHSYAHNLIRVVDTLFKVGADLAGSSRLAVLTDVEDLLPYEVLRLFDLLPDHQT